LFDTWFDSQLTMSVFDLVPDEPLTQADVDADDLGEAVARCAWCGAELEPEEGRFVSFTLPDRSRFAHREGLVLPIAVGKDQIVAGIMTSESSEAADRAEDLVVRVCTSRCEKAVRKTVTKALKRLR
jgi:hypothetical protein